MEDGVQQKKRTPENQKGILASDLNYISINGEQLHGGKLSYFGVIKPKPESAWAVIALVVWL